MIVFLCGPDELDKERRGYYAAFAKREPVALIPRERGEAWIDDVRALRPRVVLNPDVRPWLPPGIENVDAPTAAFEIDAHSSTSRRILRAPMYDYVFVFHPGYEERFAHPGLRVLPHAVERELFDRPETERPYEVGWVGRTGLAVYGSRIRILRDLVANFKMNETERYYGPEEMADVYCRSKIVVNVSGDAAPQDANLRCFEAMASGALLVNRVPTELTQLGFAEGVHFVGYRQPEEVKDVVRRWLEDDDGREAIARRARELVLREHTYDARVETILATITDGTRAPARSWPRAKQRQRHFEYAVEQADARESLRWLRRVAAISPLAAAASSWRLARLAAKLIRRPFL